MYIFLYMSMYFHFYWCICAGVGPRLMLGAFLDCSPPHKWGSILLNQELCWPFCLDYLVPYSGDWSSSAVCWDYRHAAVPLFNSSFPFVSHGFWVSGLPVFTLAKQALCPLAIFLVPCVFISLSKCSRVQLLNHNINPFFILKVSASLC